MEIIEPRPTLAAVAGTLALPRVIEWLRLRGKAPDDNGAFLHALVLIFEAEPDAYRIARFGETQWNWPSDQDLVVILLESIHSALNLHETAVKEWVLRTGVRFPRQPREAVLFRDAEGELCHGIVQTVHKSTAEAIVAVITDLEERTRTTPMVKLRAEEVVERSAAV
jgi:hypothetical protein